MFSVIYLSMFASLSVDILHKDINPQSKLCEYSLKVDANESMMPSANFLAFSSCWKVKMVTQ